MPIPEHCNKRRLVPGVKRPGLDLEVHRLQQHAAHPHAWICAQGSQRNCSHRERLREARGQPLLAGQVESVRVLT